MLEVVISSAIDTLSWILLAAGGFFYLVGAIGLNRMPDVFTRMHAGSVGDTLGAGMLVAGMVLQAGPTLVAVKLLIILAVLLFTGAVATHALARAAFNDDLFPLLSQPDGKLELMTSEQTVKPVEDLSPVNRIRNRLNKEGSKSSKP